MHHGHSLHQSEGRKQITVQVTLPTLKTNRPFPLIVVLIISLGRDGVSQSLSLLVSPSRLDRKELLANKGAKDNRDSARRLLVDICCANDHILQ